MNQLKKILENDLEHQYAVLIYRRNINSLYANKELFMQYTAAVPAHTSIGVFYDKKDDIINTLKQRCYSDEYIGQLNIQTDITWGDLKILYHPHDKSDCKLMKPRLSSEIVR